MNTTTSHESTMTEAEFLDAQAADAQAALQETWNDLKGTFRETASLEVWTQRHPWLVTGAAVAGGFLLATVLFAPIEEPEPADKRAEEQPVPRGRSRRRFSRLFTLFTLVRPILGQLITSLIGALVTGAGAAMAPSSDDGQGGPTTGGGGPAPAAEGPLPI